MSTSPSHAPRAKARPGVRGFLAGNLRPRQIGFAAVALLCLGAQPGPPSSPVPTPDGVTPGRPLPVVTPLGTPAPRAGDKTPAVPSTQVTPPPPPVAAPAAGSLPSQALRIPGPLSPRNASYRLRAALDPKTHQVVGTGTLVWRNLERQPADRVVLHLYQNAFKSHASTFIREAGPQLRGDEMPRGEYGAIDVTALKVGGKDLLDKAAVVDTLMTVPLPTPVGPSATVEIELGWKVQLPGTFARSGFRGDFHAVTQWFPKIGVWDCPDAPATASSPVPPTAPVPATAASATPASSACRWRAHQYHGFTEFFADWGTYEVDLEVPEGFDIAASGVRVSESRADGKLRARYIAEDVHDFAWFADRRFIRVDEHIDDDWGGVDVHLFTRHGQEIHNARHLSAVRAALLESERRLGVYPYRAISVVVPPADAGGAGGMEYPTLVTSIATPLPQGIRGIEVVTVHEFAHQYFYHLVGSDEVEEAWLDEGLTETLSMWAMERLFPSGCSVLNLPYVCLDYVDQMWLGARRSVGFLPLSTRSLELPGMIYSGMTYATTALSMRTLERYLGPERMMTALRRYVDRYRFRHPQAGDFMAAMSEGAGEDLSWFFTQMIQSSRTADYAVTRIHNEPRPLASGLFDCPPQPLPQADGIEAPLAENPQRQEDLAELRQKSQEAACAGKPPGRHLFEPPPAKPGDKLPQDSVILIQRRGDFIFPVDIEIELEDHSKQRERWTLAEQQAAPEQRLKIIRLYRLKSPVHRVEVDPDQKLLLDRERLNNSLYAKPERTAPRRLWLSWLGAVQTLMDLVSL
ncbi:MAG: M1 family aminopeptidase [Polyangia bacterium]